MNGGVFVDSLRQLLELLARFITNTLPALTLVIVAVVIWLVINYFYAKYKGQ